MAWLAQYLAKSPKQDNHNTNTIKPSDAGIGWQLWQANALLHAQNRARVYANWRSHITDYYQTLILAVDFEHNTLLLDEFYPEISYQDICQRGAFELHLDLSDKCLQILCIAIPKTEHQASGIHVKILAKTQAQQTTIRSVSFNKPLAPRAHLVVPLNGIISGTVQSLLATGCNLVVPGRVEASLRGAKADCTIPFSPEFQLQTRAKIRAIQFQRSPHFHSFVHLSFEHTSAKQASQLQVFIELLAARELEGE